MIILYFIIDKILKSTKNYTEVKEQEVYVTEKQTEEGYSERGSFVYAYITIVMYKGKQIKIKSQYYYNKAVIGEKMKVKMKLWYKNGFLRKFQVI